MIFGMTTFTAVHVLLSLIGIAAGLVVLVGMRTSQLLAGWTLLFLATTLATSVTGFLFPFHGFTPALAVGVLSVVILAGAIAARYGFHFVGKWRAVYVVTAVSALYFNSFVLVVQAFLKIPALHSLAPNGAGPVFALVHVVVLVFYGVAGVLCFKAFRPATLAVHV